MKKIILITLLYIGQMYSQEFTYNGNVNQNGEPLAGASVCVKSTNNCTSTNFDGNYTLKVKKGDIIIISYVGLKTTEFVIDESILSKSKVNQGKMKIVENIESNDYINQLQSKEDSITFSVSSGKFFSNYFKQWGSVDKLFFSNDETKLKSIKKNKGNIYHLKYDNGFNKLYIEFNNEVSLGTVISSNKFQKTYSQGRSLNGALIYQSPETNELFSWGPNINTLEYSTTTSPYYSQGSIVNKGEGNGKPIQLFPENNFFKNSYNFKTGLVATLKAMNDDYLKISLNYNRGSFIIPNTNNEEITTTLKFFKTIKNSHLITSQLSYNGFENNLSDSNFVMPKIFFANAMTPIHFDNRESSLLANGDPRSFSSLANNPYYLLDFNQDKNKSQTFSFKTNYSIEKDDNSFVSTVIAQNSKIKNTNSNLPSILDVSNLSFNERVENYTFLTFSSVFKHEYGYQKFVETKLTYQFQNRDLNRDFYQGFFSLLQFPNNGVLVKKINQSQNRHELTFNVNGAFKIEEIFGYYDNLSLYASSDLHYSSTLKDKAFINYSGSAFWDNFSRFNITIYTKYSFAQLEPSLQNNNLNFNSLQYKLADINLINNDQELFTSNQNSTTQEKQTTVGIKLNNFSLMTFNIECFYKKVNNLYAPVLTNNLFSWIPAVDYYQKGIEIDFEKRARNYYGNRKLNYNFNLNFSLYRNKVTSLKSSQNAIAMAGFSDVNKSYIEGQPLGVIVGNGYLRNENNQILIDNDGFPIKDSNPKILGDPNPDFVIGFDNKFTLKNFTLNITLDWHQGGQIWNGTEQALNYYGKSQATESLRNIKGFVFDGITQNGQVNTTPVDFYNPNLPVDQNRWVRYGIAGLSEENIIDASYFRLNNIGFSYQGETTNRDFKYKITLYANNLFVISKNNAAFVGNTLFNSTETTGLNYFNSPIVTVTGISFTVNF